MSATFVVTVADSGWFVAVLATALFEGQVEAFNAVAPGGEAFLRPDGMSPFELRKIRERAALA